MRPFAQVDSTTGMTSYRPDFTQPPNLVTNGQYRLAVWEFKRRARLVANDCYWNRSGRKEPGHRRHSR